MEMCIRDRGTEILSLERYIDGKARRADIFERPVAFNPCLLYTSIARPEIEKEEELQENNH